MRKDVEGSMLAIFKIMSEFPLGVEENYRN